ncbi:MAG: HAMP domain-containing sensor histidine kinase [Bacilli bacterium]|nr:HAMP domain-containing sensor histidine kinase [Bacilli bacterium]
MGIWFYLFLLELIISLILIIKIVMLKNEIKNIGDSLLEIINADTNNLLTLGINDKSVKRLVNTLNKSLKIMRKLELEYKNGNQDLKQSITNISHDLRTPLTAIRGYLDLIDLKSLNKKQREYINIISKKTNDLTSLTEQLFDFSKSLDTFCEINKKDIIINRLLEETICDFYDLIKEKNLDIEVKITDKKIIKSLDEAMLKRIFENILSNAIKYSEDKIVISLDEDGIISFSNTTSLLDLTSVEKIFNRYYTVNNAKKSGGIGLSIAKQLVELNNGTIEATFKKKILTIRIWF